MPILGNYVTFVDGVPKALHATRWALVSKSLTDPLTGAAKTIQVLEFVVDREDGEIVSKTWSVTSEKLAQTLQPFLAGGMYLSIEFVITANGQGFTRRWSVSTRKT